jgi:hypothetical protein
MLGRKRMRRLVMVLACLAAALPAAASAAGPKALVVLPPGEWNSITFDAFLKNLASGDCNDLGPNVCDQLEGYKNWRFRQGPLSSDPSQVADAVGEQQPADGVTIVRDKAGVPHVFASGPDEQAIEQRLAFGIGYAQAEERLFQMEILRRAGEGRLSELLGPDYLTMDQITRRDSETAAERQAEIASLSPGQQHSLQAYADGINAVIERDTLDPTEMPAGFSLLQDLPIRPWTSSDTLAVGILVVKGVAESAGNELGYGSLARRLAAKYGLRHAVAILDDLQFTGDPQTPTTVPARQSALRTTDRLRYRLIKYTRADTARRISALAPDVEAADKAMLSGDQAEKQATVSLGLPVLGSNAWAIAPSKSGTGHALLWGGPQVSYYAPPVLDEIEAGRPVPRSGSGCAGRRPGRVDRLHAAHGLEHHHRPGRPGRYLRRPNPSRAGRRLRVLVAGGVAPGPAAHRNDRLPDPDPRHAADREARGAGLHRPHLHLLPDPSWSAEQPAPVCGGSISTPGPGFPTARSAPSGDLRCRRGSRWSMPTRPPTCRALTPRSAQA